MQHQMPDTDALFSAAKSTGLSVVAPYEADLIDISQRFNCTIERIQRQFLLHAPYFDEDIVLSGRVLSASSKMRDILQNRISAYNLALSTYEDNIHLGCISLTDNCIIESCDDIKFKEVPFHSSELIEGKLHYLQFFRKDAAFRFGLFAKEADLPFAYASFTLCDRPYIAEAVHSFLGIPIYAGVILNVCRIFVADGAPRYSVSRLLSLSISELTRRKFDLFVTAVNPYLLFDGNAIKSSSFTAFASSPVSYNYNSIGIYTPRRSRQSIFPSKWNPPNNFILMKSPIKKIKSAIRRSNNIVHIPTDGHDFIEEVPVPGSGKARLRYVIGEIRSQLELVWDDETRYHKTPFNPRHDKLSKGQCGVSSAFLAQRMKDRGYDVRFCEGDVLFADSPPIKEHCWLVLPRYMPVSDTEKAVDLVIDITADQSGFSNSVICDSYENLEARGISYRELRRLAPNQIGVEHLWSRLDLLKDRLNDLGGDES